MGKHSCFDETIVWNDTILLSRLLLREHVLIIIIFHVFLPPTGSPHPNKQNINDESESNLEHPTYASCSHPPAVQDSKGHI